MPPPVKLIPRTESELRSLAEAIRDKRIFTTWELPARDLQSFQTVFLPFYFMHYRHAARLVERAGLIYEEMALAIRDRHDARPIFASFQALTPTDTDRLIEILRGLV